MPEQPPDRAGLDQLMESIEADDAERARLLLDSDPDLRTRINEPIGPFDLPPLAGAQSRAMLVVGESRAAIRNEHHLEVEHHGVTRGGLAANVGFRACNEKRVDTQASQHSLQRG